MLDYSQWTSTQLSPPGLTGRVDVYASASPGVQLLLGSNSTGAQNGQGVSLSLFSGDVTESADVTVFARTVDGMTPFPANAVAAISVRQVDATNQPQVLICNIPLQGVTTAPLLILHRDETGALLMRRPEVKKGPGGVAGWYVARRAELGKPVSVKLHGIAVDRSASMQAHGERVQTVLNLLRDVCAAVGEDEPRVIDVPVGGSSNNGVGCARMPEESQSQQWVLVSDLPRPRGEAPTVVIAHTEAIHILHAASSPTLGLDETFWQKVGGKEGTHNQETMQAMDVFVGWFESLCGEEGQR